MIRRFNRGDHMIKNKYKRSPLVAHIKRSSHHSRPTKVSVNLRAGHKRETLWGIIPCSRKLVSKERMKQEYIDQFYTAGNGARAVRKGLRESTARPEG